MPSEEWQLAELPGPRRFFARISQAVDTGRNVIVVVPRSALSSTLAEEIREGIQRARCVHAYLSDATLEHCSGSIPEAAARTLDFINPLDDSQHHNRWLSYLNHPESGGKTVLIARWNTDVTDDVSYWLRLVHSSSLEPENRPTFVFLVHDADVNIESLTKEHAPHLTVLWWWDVIGLLDSELCADWALTGEQITPLRRAMLAESVGWELHLAGKVARMWGISDVPSLLVKALRENADGPAFTLTTEEQSALTASNRTDVPPAVLRDAWNAGHVNSWEGQLLPSVRYAEFERSAGRRFWSAQSRILMPYLERERQRLAKRFEKLASPEEVEEVKGQSGLLELGPMQRGHFRHYVDFGAADEKFLSILVKVRNKIAHHDSLGDDLYAAISDICS